MTSAIPDIVWQKFEKDAKLSLSPEYRRIVIRAMYSQQPGLNCTQWTDEFFRSQQTYTAPEGAANMTEAERKALRKAFDATTQAHYHDFMPGRVLIGPDTSTMSSYTHEAVAIKSKKTSKIVSVIEPIQNALGGQRNCRRASANDRYSLKDWLDYKTRFYHMMRDSYDREHLHRPFCVFALNHEYKLGTSGYQVVVGSGSPNP